MMYLSGFGRRVCFGLKTPQCAAIVFAVMSAGCSADVARFDSSSFNLNDPPESAQLCRRRLSLCARRPIIQTRWRIRRRAGHMAPARSRSRLRHLPDPTAGRRRSRGRYTDQSWKRSPMAAAQARTAPP